MDDRINLRRRAVRETHEWAVETDHRRSGPDRTVPNPTQKLIGNRQLRREQTMVRLWQAVVGVGATYGPKHFFHQAALLGQRHLLPPWHFRDLVERCPEQGLRNDVQASADRQLG